MAAGNYVLDDVDKEEINVTVVDPNYGSQLLEFIIDDDKNEAADVETEGDWSDVKPEEYKQIETDLPGEKRAGISGGGGSPCVQSGATTPVNANETATPTTDTGGGGADTGGGGADTGGGGAGGTTSSGGGAAASDASNATKDLANEKPTVSKALDAGQYYVNIIPPNAVKLHWTPSANGKTAAKKNVPGWIGDGFKNFINASLFEANGEPTGLFIFNGQQYGFNLSKFEGFGWPVFVIEAGKAYVTSSKLARANVSNIKYACMGSHYLVKNGKAQSIPEWATNGRNLRRPRTAAGVTANGQVYVAVTNKPTPWGDWMSTIIASGGHTVINFDGGGSSTIVRGGSVVAISEGKSGRPVSTILYWT